MSWDDPTVDQGLRLLLPDMADPALTERVTLNAHRLTLQVSGVAQYKDYGPDFDVVHAWVLREDGEPLALRDIRPGASSEAAYNLWSFMCEQLTAAATLVYGLRPADDGTPNPRLGCWGPRPDLAKADADDGATAFILGVATDRTRATREPREDLLILSIRSAIVVSLRRWASEALDDLP
jgi:hypothetical protein